MAQDSATPPRSATPPHSEEGKPAKGKSHTGKNADPVTLEVNDGVAVITLNRPDNRNSMTPELLCAYGQIAQQARRDGSVRCVVVTGSGSCFSAGADFRSQIQAAVEGKALQPDEQSFEMYRSFLQTLEFEVPVIGALNGHAVGGGFGLALLCDMRVAHEGAKYGANFARLGLHSGLGISYLLPRLVGLARANELLFTGRLVRGHEAATMGLVNQAVAADQVLSTAMEMATTVASNGPYAVRTMKQSIRQGLGWDVVGAARQEAYAQSASVQTADAKEGMTALLEKRTPVFSDA